MLTESYTVLPGQLQGHYKGFAGGIRCISCLDKQEMVASCGLDKFLRVHHLHNRKLLYKVGTLWAECLKSKEIVPCSLLCTYPGCQRAFFHSEARIVSGKAVMEILSWLRRSQSQLC